MTRSRPASFTLGYGDQGVTKRTEAVKAFILQRLTASGRLEHERRPLPLGGADDGRLHDFYRIDGHTAAIHVYESAMRGAATIRLDADVRVGALAPSEQRRRVCRQDKRDTDEKFAADVAEAMLAIADIETAAIREVRAHAICRAHWQNNIIERLGGADVAMLNLHDSEMPEGWPQHKPDILVVPAAHDHWSAALAEDGSISVTAKLAPADIERVVALLRTCQPPTAQPTHLSGIVESYDHKTGCQTVMTVDGKTFTLERHMAAAAEAGERVRFRVQWKDGEPQVTDIDHWSNRGRAIIEKRELPDA